MMKTFVVAAAVAAVAASSVAGTALARPTIQDKPKETAVVIKDDAGEKSKQVAHKTEQVAKKTGEAVTDTSITTEVKTRLMKDKAARATSIDVDTRDGVVTIAGAVPTAADKRRIGHLVENTTGVKSVVNNLAVGKTAGTSGREADGVAIKDDNDKVAVKTDDTKIVIKDDAGEKAKDVADKTGHVAKKTGEVVGDASITTAVKTRLMTDDLARGTSIDVKTKDGVVTISGAVPTVADKARIGHLVEKTTGVKSVDNKLTVK